MKKLLTGLCVAGGLFAGLNSASADMCSSISNLIQNCGFENGTYTSGINLSVPNGWTSNAAFDDFLFNGVQPPGYTGSFELAIGNYDSEPVAALTQNLTDISGTTYQGNVWIDYAGESAKDPNAFLKVLIGSNTVLSLNYSNASSAWTEYTFSFVGSGSDLLTLEAATNPSEWYVDDFGITPGGTVPEPTSLMLLGSGLLASGFFGRRKSKKNS